MKKQQGFTLIELLIVVAIIAIIAAIAVPNLLTARMAANETSAIGALRAVGSAQVTYSIANQFYADKIDDLVDENFLDGRFATGGNINGYVIGDSGAALVNSSSTAATVAPFTATAQAFIAAPVTLSTTGRYCYGIGADMVIRYQPNAPASGGQTCTTYPTGFNNGDPVGGQSGAGS